MLAQDRRLVQIHSRAGDLWRERFVSEGAIELDDPPLRIDDRRPLRGNKAGGLRSRDLTRFVANCRLNDELQESTPFSAGLERPQSRSAPHRPPLDRRPSRAMMKA